MNRESEGGGAFAARRGGKTLRALAVVLVLAPLTLIAGSLIEGMRYYVVSALLITYALVPFFAAFEDRRPQAREIVITAVLCALAVASRAAFFWAPGIKPIVGVVMISGMALGPQTGFLVGALSAFVSNFMFGQGPWTPWQMFAYGLAGLVMGLAARRFPGLGSTLKPKELGFLCAFGAAFTLFAVGPILDTCTVFTMLSMMTPSGILAVYAAGFPLNCALAAATFVTLLLLANPLASRLYRVRRKFGLLE